MTETELIPKRLDRKIAVITGGNSGKAYTALDRCCFIINPNLRFHRIFRHLSPCQINTKKFISG
jgi:hypothetical protein